MQLIDRRNQLKLIIFLTITVKTLFDTATVDEDEAQVIPDTEVLQSTLILPEKPPAP